MDTSLNNTTSLCDQAKSITGTIELLVIYIFQVLVACLAIFPNILALYLLWRIKIFHLDLRLLLANLNLDLIAYSIAIAEKAIERLLTPPCSLPMLIRPCLVREWLTVMPLHNALISLVTLSLERLYASLRYRTYDRTKRPYVSIVLLLCSWNYTLYVQASSYLSAPEDLRIPVCEGALFLSSKQLTSVLSTFVVFESIALGVSIFVYVYNRFLLQKMTINRAKFDLASRFQADQNVKLNKALFPSDLLHVLCYLPNYLFLLLTMCDVSLALSTRMWFLHLTYLYRLVYAMVHPILLMTRNASLRQGLMKTAVGKWMITMWNEKRKINDNHMMGNAMNLHFDHLAKAWSEGQVNRKRAR